MTHPWIVEKHDKSENNFLNNSINLSLLKLLMTLTTLRIIINMRVIPKTYQIIV